MQICSWRFVASITPTGRRNMRRIDHVYCTLRIGAWPFQIIRQVRIVSYRQTTVLITYGRTVFDLDFTQSNRTRRPFCGGPLQPVVYTLWVWNFPCYFQTVSEQISTPLLTFVISPARPLLRLIQFPVCSLNTHEMKSNLKRIGQYNDCQSSQVLITVFRVKLS